MLTLEQNDWVIEYLAQHFKRPQVAIRVWTRCVHHLCTDTGEIMLRRDELAGQLGLSSSIISGVMTELESIGAIIRRRERIAGLRGRGIVRYFINPRVSSDVTPSGALSPHVKDAFTIVEL